jgi:MoaA/NifB/PqqE/SkfB family radical SAM enzyme
MKRLSLSAFEKNIAFGASLVRKHPFQCLVQVTNRCNMKCGFCDFWRHGNKKAELTVEDYRRFSDALSALGVFLISLEGGEPLLRQDIAEIVSVFSKHHLTVLYTNGWHVDNAMASKLFSAGLNRIGVSIDFPDATRHDQARGRSGAFERALSAVECLKKASNGKAVHIMSLLTRENQNDIEALLKLSEKSGVGHAFTLLSKKGTLRGQNFEMPDAGAMRCLPELFRRYSHLRSFRNYLEKIPSFLEKRNRPENCVAGVKSFNLDASGNLSACIERIGKSVGNIREQAPAALLAQCAKDCRFNACDECWTLCRGVAETMANPVSCDWMDLIFRM